MGAGNKVGLGVGVLVGLGVGVGVRVGVCVGVLDGVAVNVGMAGVGVSLGVLMVTITMEVDASVGVDAVGIEVAITCAIILDNGQVTKHVARMMSRMPASTNLYLLIHACTATLRLGRRSAPSRLAK